MVHGGGDGSIWQHHLAVGDFGDRGSTQPCPELHLEEDDAECIASSVCLEGAHISRHGEGAVSTTQPLPDGSGSDSKNLHQLEDLEAAVPDGVPRRGGVHFHSVLATLPALQLPSTAYTGAAGQ